MTSSFATADLMDAHGDELAVMAPILRAFGGRRDFAGPISTIRTHEDNSRVAEAVEEPGAGRVLVVDGGGSLRHALLGDRLAGLARDNGWVAIVLWACVRDTEVLATLDVGVLALAPCPLRSRKRDGGERDVPVTFGGVDFTPGHWLYADPDGVVVGPRRLSS